MSLANGFSLAAAPAKRIGRVSRKAAPFSKSGINRVRISGTASVSYGQTYTPTDFGTV